MLDIVKLFYDNGRLNKNKLKRKWIEKNYNDLHIELIKFENSLNIEIEKFTQLIWHYNTNTIDYPICEYCKSYNKRFYGLETGYKLGCNKHCAIQLTRKSSNKTRLINTLEKYGVKHTTQLKSTQDKMKQTNLERYGFEHPSKNEDIKDKIKQTNLKKWGVELPLQNIEIKDKMKINFIEKWGVDNPSKCESVSNKKKKTNLENWGVEWSISHPDIKNKIKTTTDINFFEKIKKTYINSNKVTLLSYSDGIIKFNCIKCNNDFEIKTNLLHQRYFKNEIDICLHCNPIDNKISNGHNEVISFLNDIGIVNIEVNTRSIINPYELDIYLPDYKLGIEFNGVFWHSELNKNKNYHNFKRLECKNKNIELLQIWEDDWKYKNDIIKSILINRLGKSINNIGARKCEIKEVSSILSKKFLNENHIQGWSVSKYRFGLFYKDELVSLITFSKGRVNLNSNKDEYELVRYCNKLNFNVVGGLSKLYKHFIKIENPKVLISYCDQDLFKGDSYIKLGMKLDSHSINYYWCDGRIRWNRWNFRKDKLVKDGFDQNMSEYEIMMSRGWYRCWGSGNNKYILTNS